MGFPKMRDSFWDPQNKDCSSLALYWGAPLLGNYPVGNSELTRLGWMNAFVCTHLETMQPHLLSISFWIASTNISKLAS